MTIGQLGLFVGLVVATSLRILANKDNVMSLFSPPYTPYGEQIFEVQPAIPSGLTRQQFGVIFAVGFIPFIASLFLKENVNNIISLISSLLCPIFIVIMPAWLNIKLRAHFNYSPTKVFFIKFYVFFFSVLLSMSIGVNVYKFVTGESVVG